MPEEINRVATDHLSELLFCPTATAVENLRNEGLTQGVHLSGDVMLDAVLAFRKLAAKRKETLPQAGVESRQYALLTIHRAENTEEAQQLIELFEMLLKIKFPVLFPMHPRLRDKLSTKNEMRPLKRALAKARHIRTIAPV